jgi:hypothetical protein
MTTEENIAETKQARKDLDLTLQFVKIMTGDSVGMTARDPSRIRRSPERLIAITKIREGIMWLGMDLKAINEESPGSSPSPYPESYNPESPVIEPPADGLKL